MTLKNTEKQQGRTVSIKGAEVGLVLDVNPGKPLALASGTIVPSFPIAYQAYGKLNAEKTNAILFCHALSGDQYVASPNPLTGKPGWWESIIGSGKPFDTDKYFIICTNVIGSCMGSWGPSSINPETGKAYGLSFPVITIGDMVEAQKLFLEQLGIDSLFAVVGGSMGGMQAMEWAARYPDKVFSVVLASTATRHTAQNIAFHEAGRQAIMSDPNWKEGRYMDSGIIPHHGLAVARMIAHITYLSEAALHRKFGRNLNRRENFSFAFDQDFSVESYLHHQGSTFVERFDANSYLYITRAIDYFDLETEFGTLSNAFKNSLSRFCVVSFSSDWLFPTSESRRLVHALCSVAANVSFVEIQTDKGHDAFLLEEPEFFRTISAFLDSAGKKRGL